MSLTIEGEPQHAREDCDIPRWCRRRAALYRGIVRAGAAVVMLCDVRRDLCPFTDHRHCTEENQHQDFRSFGKILLIPQEKYP